MLFLKSFCSLRLSALVEMYSERDNCATGRLYRAYTKRKQAHKSNLSFLLPPPPLPTSHSPPSYFQSHCKSLYHVTLSLPFPPSHVARFQNLPGIYGVATHLHTFLLVRSRGDLLSDSLGFSRRVMLTLLEAASPSPSGRRRPCTLIPTKRSIRRL